ncbi:MAG: DnaJ domain-containing protein [Methylovulum sp.]|nr:DnaJ domain-containing protein [Methylovulum sp.]
MNTEELIEKIYEVEGFTVWIPDLSDNLRDYYKREYNGDSTVSDWKKRFKNRYKGFDVDVEKGNGYEARGNMLLRNIRKSYSLDNLRKEIYKLTLSLDYERTKNNSNINDENNESDPYKVLGVDNDCDFSKIQHAYRRLCRSFHPDKLVSFGLHQELLDFANKRQQEINIAYQQLKDRNM